MARQEAVDSQQRAQPREACEGGIGRHHQNDHRGRDQGQVHHVTAAKHRAPQLRDHRLHFRWHCADLARQESDAQEEDTQDGRHPDQRDAGVAAARLFEGSDAVRDRLNAGECGGAARKRVQDQEGRDRLHGLNRFHRRRIHHLPQRARHIADHPDEHRRCHHHQEEIAGDGESRARFPHAAQVDHHHEQDQSHRDLNPKIVEPGKR